MDRIQGIPYRWLRRTDMAILAIFSGKGITQKMYESLRPETNWEKNHPPGGLFHAAGFDDKGDLHVADVWESTEAMDKSISSRLMPAMKKLNIPAPAVQIFPLHNMNVYPAADRYQLKK
jgi:hypothetical protein